MRRSIRQHGLCKLTSTAIYELKESRPVGCVMGTGHI